MTTSIVFNSDGASGQVTCSYSSGVHTFTVSSPAAPNDWAYGDMIIVMLALHSPPDASGSLPAAPSGWTLAGYADQLCDDGSRMRSGLYWKIRNTGDSSTYVFTSGIASARDTYAHGALFIARGVKKFTILGAATTTVRTYTFSPITGQTLIDGKYTKAGDIAGCLLSDEPHIFNVGQDLFVSRYTYPDLFSGVVTASGVNLPVSFDAVPADAIPKSSVVFGFRFNLISDKGAGLFGGRLF